MDLFSKFRSLFSKPEPLSPSESAFGELSGLPPERRGRERLNAREGLKVLVIDDSATVCAALKKILKSAKFQVEQAMDAETGLALVQTGKPDLIFLDIVLPRMNGFSALRHLRRDPHTRNIPVIMISGNELATEQFFGNAIGADDFMKKPFSRYEVFARIERLLDDDLVPQRKTASTGHAPLSTAHAPLAT
ncbi:MAG: response regulator [Burkholderiales bacterium PBB4]|nr:MAG: response regulator [Burkholderiales bacterium PBB4]